MILPVKIRAASATHNWAGNWFDYGSDMNAKVLAVRRCFHAARAGVETFAASGIDIRNASGAGADADDCEPRFRIGSIDAADTPCWGDLEKVYAELFRIFETTGDKSAAAKRFLAVCSDVADAIDAKVMDYLMRPSL